MKKLVFTAFLCFFSLLSFSQVTQNLGDFTAVRAFDMIHVTLVKSTENKVVIKGDRAGEVEVVIKNSDLKIRMKFSKLLQGEDIEATIYYTGRIDNVEASEGAYVGSADTFTATAFELNAKEGAQIKLKLDVDKLKTKANSGGILEISGTADYHDLKMTSGAIFKGKNLITKQTEVTLSAGGEADVYATDFADAKTRAGGDIDIYGNPKQVNKNSFAGGSIDVM
ncbi:head GIN domain-containing protein [Flavobacterium rhizosphaerae]|uniref:Head GIN domain-containing protein n=1 Tax=Flavobacterium rhizosphaerae TaxID=3163298 RepID=A0ABW8YXW1_9FLAO